MAFRLLVCLLAVGCVDSAHNLDIGEPPLLVLRGKVDRLSLRNPNAFLLAGLVWTKRPVPSRVCLEFGPRLPEACPDPLGVTFDDEPAQVVQPVQANGDFDLPIFAPPPGDPVFGSVVVVEDVVDSKRVTFMRRGHIPPGFGSRDFEYVTDNLVAASFYTLRTWQVRLVSDRGRGHLYEYPLPDLPECILQDGYNWLSVLDRVTGPCQFIPTTSIKRAPAFILSREEALDVSCRQEQDALIQLADGPAPQFKANDRIVCLSDGMFAAISASECHRMSVWTLRGCIGRNDGRVDPFCDRPEERVSERPSWWPCPDVPTPFP